MKLILENVRGFVRKQEIPIRPLTILVGENSSGKSTLLALVSAVFQSGFPSADNIFNRSPFELGTFDTIATYKGGKFGRATSFTIGFSTQNRGNEILVEATYENMQGSPALRTATWQSPEIAIKYAREGERSRVDINYLIAKKNTESELSINLKDSKSFRLDDLPSLIAQHYFQNSKDSGSVYRKISLDDLFNAVFKFDAAVPSVVGLAPLRTKPHRTYDQLIEEFSPAGDHVPLMLSRLSRGGSTKDSKHQEKIDSFGHESSLFDQIRVKRMGKRPSDPFQLRVKGVGPDVNLVDVGYGVSQALPIVVDSILAKSRQMLLVQQPEVHLHPRAQAALGSFFVDQVVNENKRFVIETHSDYLVDRIRMEIASKRIKATDVQLIFLFRTSHEITVYPLQLDEMGNVTNAPNTYRSFFLEEEYKLLTRGGDDADNN